MKLRNLLPVIGIIIFIIILLTIDIRQIIRIFSEINPLYGFLSFFVLVPLLLLAGIEWQLLLKKQKIHVSFWYSIKNFFIGYFYGFITPGGFGAFTRALYLSDESSIPLPKCVSNVIIFNIVEFISMLLVGAIGAIYLSSIFPYLFYTIVFILIIVVVLFLFFFKSKRSKIWFFKIVQSRVFSAIKERIEGSVDTFFEDIPKFKDVILPIFISISGWVLKYIMFFYIAKMFFITISPITFIMIMAVSDVISSIPISTYGLGVRDLTYIGLFPLFIDVAVEKIVSLSIFWFVIIWLTPSIIGVFVTVYETRKINKIKIDEITSRRFENYMKKFPELYNSLASIVKNYVSNKIKKPIIIDLGCGPGLLSKEINKLIPNGKIIGMDQSVDMLKIARENAKIETIQVISEKIPLDNDSADALVSRFSLTYWKNPKESFSEIYRVLKPNGIVVMELLNREYPRWKIFYRKIAMIFKGAGWVARYHADAYKTAYTFDNAKKLIINSGFKINNIIGNKRNWSFIIVANK